MRSRHDERGVLIVVMGTSGTGKSTLGMTLSERFNIPFVDGDDLHPSTNVEKMSHGQPLDDDDRLPWLVRIRHAAFELTDDSIAVSSAVRDAEEERAEEASQSGHEEQKARVRKMAEVLETSKQSEEDDDDGAEAPAGSARPESSSSSKPCEASTSSFEPGAACPSTRSETRKPRRACLIACSALKRKYRDLLRSHLGHEQYPEPDDRDCYEGQALDVYFLYICVPEYELVRRMHERKGHFMKESMLRSQLETLEEPHEKNEPGVLTLDGVGPKEEVEHRAEKLIHDKIGPLRGPRRHAH
ncbi:hypothetical protein V8E36_008038 [Tilletia maclaganii]